MIVNIIIFNQKGSQNINNVTLPFYQTRFILFMFANLNEEHPRHKVRKKTGNKGKVRLGMSVCEFCGTEDEVYKCKRCGALFCEYCGSVGKRLCVDCLGEFEE